MQEKQFLQESYKLHSFCKNLQESARILQEVIFLSSRVSSTYVHFFQTSTTIYVAIARQERNKNETKKEIKQDVRLNPV